ncbi:hypothetical protein [Hyphomicrobium sp.]|uniref:hypothetical protein n=1 Tax=Hyphomicrobium sp. TaxID=82 RepID=UPI001DE7FCAB|nr:hypothetical protein [Hyphomicrobium sp.]MBY0559567.1 hypothetical protein [Hyphomicrobium sp.]
MKTWVVLFLLLLAAGIAWGVARDVFSRVQGTVVGTVTAVDFGNPLPKWYPPTPPHYTARLPDGSLVTVSARIPLNIPVGGAITITELVTPWGQVWYRQRD